MTCSGYLYPALSTVTMCICGREQYQLYIWFTLVLHYCNMSNLSEKYNGKNENKPCLRTFRTTLVDIRLTTSDKVLGVHVDDNLSWNDHLHHVSKKVSSFLWLLSTIKTYLSKEHKLLYYNSYIKLHFDYCSVIWSNSSNFNVNKINKLQRRACKLILSHDYKSLNESLEQLDILSLDQSVFLN